MAHAPKPKPLKWKKSKSRWKESRRYNTVSWRYQREEAIKRHPKCYKCGKPGKREGNRVKGLTADHGLPERLWPHLGTAQSNLYPMCTAPCHQSKSAREQQIKLPKNFDTLSKQQQDIALKKAQKEWIEKVHPYYRYIKI